MNDIYNAFHEFFEIIEADSAELLQEVYRLRYRVYCVENNFEDFKKFPNNMEKDEYDYHSVHILLKHRYSGCFIGTARMVLQDLKNPFKVFPVEKFLQIDPNLLDLNKLSRQQTAEISRFAILKQFSARRIENENLHIESNRKEKTIIERRRFPSAFLALAVGVFQMSAANKINYWMSAMSPILNRLLSYYGLKLHPIGPLTEYHGMRRPYYARLYDILYGLFLHHREIWELVTDYGKSCPYSMKYIQTKSFNSSGAIFSSKNKGKNSLIKENILI